MRCRAEYGPILTDEPFTQLPVLCCRYIRLLLSPSRQSAARLPARYQTYATPSQPLITQLIGIWLTKAPHKKITRDLL